MADTLLIIEDEELLGTELRRYFSRHGWEAMWVRRLSDAERRLLKEGLAPLVVLSDMNLPDGNALDLLEKVRERGLGGEWVMLTGYGSVPDSVRALRLGAFDFLEKPCKSDRLELIITGAARSARAQRRLSEHTDAQSQRYTPQVFAGHGVAATEVRNMLAKLAAVPYSVLVITGETGTGKGLAARVLHHTGPRSKGPLVEMNCAALPRELLESEMFGHEAGAFTGAKVRRRGLMEQADGGTLFLDEIADMDLELQAKLLKAIEDRAIRRLGGEQAITVDIQVIAATNQDLAQRVAEGTFRADLYHRLSVFRLTLPPLRAHKEDLRDMVPVFVAEYNAKAGKRVQVIPEDVWQRLSAHNWPGNVRELRNVVERCVLFSIGEIFPAQWLQLEASPVSSTPVKAGVENNRLYLPLDGTMALDEMDRYIIKTALESCGFNVTAAAKALGTTRETLRYRIQKYALNIRPDKSAGEG
jgi:two-component system response regulator AtoC